MVLITDRLVISKLVHLKIGLSPMVGKLLVQKMKIGQVFLNHTKNYLMILIQIDLKLYGLKLEREGVIINLTVLVMVLLINRILKSFGILSENFVTNMI